MTGDGALVAVAGLLRARHDTGADRRAGPPGRPLPGAPDGDVWCHNDVRPETVVFADGRPVALEPSTWAAAGTRLWDVAGAAWRWVPLHGDFDTEVLGFATGPEVKGRRLRLVADAYGLEAHDRARLLDVIERRVEAAEAVLADPSWADHPGMAAWRADRHGEGPRRDRWHITEYRDSWEPWLA